MRPKYGKNHGTNHESTGFTLMVFQVDPEFLRFFFDQFFYKLDLPPTQDASHK